jgi:hypothetical protein
MDDRSCRTGNDRRFSSGKYLPSSNTAKSVNLVEQREDRQRKHALQIRIRHTAVYGSDNPF